MIDLDAGGVSESKEGNDDGRCDKHGVLYRISEEEEHINEDESQTTDKVGVNLLTVLFY